MANHLNVGCSLSLHLLLQPWILIPSQHCHSLLLSHEPWDEQGPLEVTIPTPNLQAWPHWTHLISSPPYLAP